MSEVNFEAIENLVKVKELSEQIVDLLKKLGIDNIPETMEKLNAMVNAIEKMRFEVEAKTK